MTEREANSLGIAGAACLVVVCAICVGYFSGLFPPARAEQPAPRVRQFEIFLIGAKDMPAIQTCGAFVSGGESSWGPNGETCVWVSRGPAIFDQAARLCAVGAYAVAIGKPCGGRP